MSARIPRSWKPTGRSATTLAGVVLIGCAALPASARQAETTEITPPTHEHLAAVAIREPMVVEHPDSTLFVAGYTRAVEESGRPPKLFRSADGGESWHAVDVGEPSDGAVGNSDVDLAIGPEGTIYFLTMGFDRSRFEGTHVAVGVSRDVGVSWTWTELSRTRFDDRPWIGIEPDGTAHVIWNDGAGVRHAASHDRGASWAERRRIHDRGLSSHLAVGPGGEIAVRITPVSASGNRYDEGVDLLAVSIDGGTTWTKKEVPGTREWSPDPFSPEGLPRWVEPVAWDADGRLRHLWSEGSTLWLGSSTDQGDTWNSWPLVTIRGSLFYPYLAARGAGELAATWFSGSAEGLLVHTARIHAPAGSAPALHLAPPLRPDTWVSADGTTAPDPAGEYVPVIFLSGSDLGVVVPIQNGTAGRNGFAWYRVPVHDGRTRGTR